MPAHGLPAAGSAFATALAIRGKIDAGVARWRRAESPLRARPGQVEALSVDAGPVRVASMTAAATVQLVAQRISAHYRVAIRSVG